MATRFREAIVRLPLKHRRADLRTINDSFLLPLNTVFYTSAYVGLQNFFGGRLPMMLK